MKSKKILDIYGKRKVFFIIPIIIVAAALIVALVAGIEVSIEFKGGTLTAIREIWTRRLLSLRRKATATAR